MANLLLDGPADGPRFVLAHGAGAPMVHSWMNVLTARLAGRGLRVIRFEFAYMAARRAPGGTRRGPSPAATLEREWRDIIDELGDASTLCIGGKSMGGRIASMVADGAAVRGVVALGYPFHPPGKHDQLRTAHLEALAAPMLVLQGERDTFGDSADVAGYALSDTVTVEWMPDGDHSFKPRKASGRTLADNLDLAAERVASFVEQLAP